MQGLSATSGARLSGIGHLAQSIRDILSTPIGTRVMRRDYGSRLPELLDAPLNEATLMDVRVATVEALRRWEPRLSVTRVDVDAGGSGVLAISIAGDYRPDGQPVSLLFTEAELRSS